MTSRPASRWPSAVQVLLQLVWVVVTSLAVLPTQAASPAPSPTAALPAGTPGDPMGMYNLPAYTTLHQGIRVMQADLKTGLSLEVSAYQRVASSQDRLEGVLAFNEKRPPRFQGH